MVCSTDRSKAVVPVLVLLFVALCVFFLRGDLLYVFPCVILFFSVLLVLRLPRLGKRELILMLFVRLFGLCLFWFVGFLFLLGLGRAAVCDCGTPCNFLLPFYIYLCGLCKSIWLKQSVMNCFCHFCSISWNFTEMIDGMGSNACDKIFFHCKVVLPKRLSLSVIFFSMLSTSTFFFVFVKLYRNDNHAEIFSLMGYLRFAFNFFVMLAAAVLLDFQKWAYDYW